ncbi:Protein phosphatase 2C 2 [Pestalotiopsis sp. IQ-011]
MSRSRAPLYLGLTAAGGVGYYLYSAGGSPSVAQKQAEADAHKLSAKVKGELPGRGQEAEKKVEAYGKEAGQKFDNALQKSQAEIAKAKADAEAYAKDVKASTLKKVDEFDRKVETKAAEAKTGLSSWFGGK